MYFNPYQTEFESELQKCVWIRGKQIMPFEISAADIEDNELLEGLKQVYDFTVELYADVYENGEKYEKAARNAIEDKNTVFDKNARMTAGYVLNYFYFLEGKKVNNKTEWIVNITKKNESQLEMLDVLASLGVRYEMLYSDNLLDKHGRRMRIWNDKYPLYIQYFSRFVRESRNKIKVYVESHIAHCNFKVFNQRVHMTFDDTIRSFTDENKAFFTELNDYFVSKKIKPKSHFYREILYVYKNHYIMNIQNTSYMRSCFFEDYINVPLAFHLGDGKTPSEEGYLRLLDEIDKQPNKDELLAYITDNRLRCKGGGCDEPNREFCGRFWLMLAVNKTTTDFSNDHDMRMLKQLLDLRIAVINQ